MPQRQGCEGSMVVDLLIKILIITKANFNDMKNQSWRNF